MSTLTRPAIPTVLWQHLEDTAVLRGTRAVLLRAPHVELHRLARLDERLESHLDGLRVAGDDGYRLAQAALERPAVGELFALASLAIERSDKAQLQRLLALASAVPEAPRALTSAAGWVPPQALRGLTVPLLASSDAWQRWLGLAACAAHRVDPGLPLLAAVSDLAVAPVRVRAVQIAGQLGRADLLPTLLQHLSTTTEPSHAKALTWSAVLLGDRQQAFQRLCEQGVSKEGPSLEALQLALLAADTETARTLVRRLIAEGAPLRTTIRATGWAGDVQAVPWLIKQMADPAQTRLAGEAFSFITGANLALLDLEAKGAEAPATGPNDNPADDSVALDEDENLPLPDVARVQAWWDQHAATMPTGSRCFAGAAPTRAHCLRVLRQAGQRQRYAAALLLSLAAPGTPLFNTAAPAWRQQRALQAAGE